MVRTEKENGERRQGNEGPGNGKPPAYSPDHQSLTFRSLDEEWFWATLVPKAELSFRTPRRWRVQGALPKGRKVLERGAPAPLFNAPSSHEQPKTKRKGAKAARSVATKIPVARDSRRVAESAEKKFCNKCRLFGHSTAKTQGRKGSKRKRLIKSIAGA
jgi:hypothetical protein